MKTRQPERQQMTFNQRKETIQLYGDRTCFCLLLSCITLITSPCLCSAIVYRFSKIGTKNIISK